MSQNESGYSGKSGGSVGSITASLADNPIAGVNVSIAMMTKGGLNAMTRSLAIEHAKRRYPRECYCAWSG